MNDYRRTIALIPISLLMGLIFFVQPSCAQNRQTNGRNKANVEMKTVISDFNSYLETVPFYASASLEKELSVVEGHINNLNNWKDKSAYIAE